MPNITRIVGMHNQVDEANTDKVWAGLVLRHDDGRYQFVALYGPRLGTIRPALQAMTSSFRANQKFDQMYREKLSHGYSVIDWTEPRYALRGSITRQGNVAEAMSVMPAGRQVRLNDSGQTVRISQRAVEPRATAAVEHMAPRVPEPTPAESVPATATELADYIRRHTLNADDQPQATPEPKPEQPQPKAPIRKARRLDF